jgi:hypothetical protein
VTALHEEHKGMGDQVARRIEQQWLKLQHKIHDQHKLKQFNFK